ncbi:hypothetical protein R6Q59_017859 [Mikania micrantha]
MAPKSAKLPKASTSSPVKSLLYVSSHEINWSPTDFSEFLQEFRILPEWNPELPATGLTALNAPPGYVSAC